MKGAIASEKPLHFFSNRCLQDRVMKLLESSTAVSDPAVIGLNGKNFQNLYAVKRRTHFGIQVSKCPHPRNREASGFQAELETG